MAAREMLYVNRETGKVEQERIICSSLVKFFIETRIGRALYSVLCKNSLFSRIVGWCQRLRVTRYFIKPFVTKYRICIEESASPLHDYASFNDFFVRKLKPDARPICQGEDICVTPADGAYLVFPSMADLSLFTIKNKPFSLESFLGDPQLAHQYAQGSVAIARLAPFDYHRFHFPIAGIAEAPRRINGHLFSIHPLMLKRNFEVFTENKREITIITSKEFGEVAYVEVGALNVGSIHQTFSPGSYVKKGAEKGFFAFGGSTVVLLFQPQRIIFDADLVGYSAQGLETRCRMGQSLGKRFSS